MSQGNGIIHELHSYNHLNLKTSFIKCSIFTRSIYYTRSGMKSSFVNKDLSIHSLYILDDLGPYKFLLDGRRYYTPTSQISSNLVQCVTSKINVDYLSLKRLWHQTTEVKGYTLNCKFGDLIGILDSKYDYVLVRPKGRGLWTTKKKSFLLVTQLPSYNYTQLK